MKNITKDTTKTELMGLGTGLIWCLSEFGAIANSKIQALVTVRILILSPEYRRGIDTARQVCSN